MKFVPLMTCTMAIYFATVASQRTFLDNFVYKGRIGKLFFDRVVDTVRSQPYARSHQAAKVQHPIDDSVPFPCNTENFRSVDRPKNVHQLQPGDIDVIGALGDSLTAGYGALSTSQLDSFREYRGVSFPIGGEKTWRQYLTLPNIFKVYNPNLVGYSLRSSNTFERASQFNVAEPSAMSSDLPYMTKVLLKRISTDPRVHLEEDWKFVTVFMGANNFCQFCYEKSIDDILMQHKQDLVTSLRLLRDNLPRTFVSVVNPPHVDLLVNFTHLPPDCWISQRISCSCVVGDTNGANRVKVKDLIRRWQRLEEEIADYEEFDREDFTVVNQPLLQAPLLPRKTNGDVDSNYFAADCFHFSQKGHALIAQALWNDILSPVGDKQKTLFSTEFKCPSREFPYLFTRKNSNVVVIK